MSWRKRGLFAGMAALVLVAIVGPYRQAAIMETLRADAIMRLDEPVIHEVSAVNGGETNKVETDLSLLRVPEAKEPSSIFSRNGNHTEWKSSTQRILMGIFSMNSAEEFSRRRLIRKTYLSTYKIFNDINLSQGPSDRICSLVELLNSPSGAFQRCWIAYTFVIGAFDKASNASAPPLLLDDDATSFTWRGNFTSTSDPEDDLTILNIRENMNEGKTLTWFKYASAILPDALNIDLIVKVDTDTVVFPRSFLEELQGELDKQLVRRPATSMYGGLREVAATGFVLDVVPFYMQGGFYFLSKDLAQDVTSNSCQRHAIIERQVNATGYRAEDREMGTLVNHCARSKVNRIIVPALLSAKHHWRHKDASNFRVAWKDALARDVARLRYREMQAKYNNGGCPPTKNALAEELRWFEERENMKQAKHQFTKLVSEECASL